MNKDKKPKIRIELPPLSLIVLLMPICALFKILGGIEWNWLVTLLVAPVLLYVLWSAALLGLALICFGLIRAIDGNNVFNRKGKEKTHESSESDD